MGSFERWRIEQAWCELARWIIMRASMATAKTWGAILRIESRSYSYTYVRNRAHITRARTNYLDSRAESKRRGTQML